jgi:predicted DNA-binding transcriptional regulator AlpA
MTMFKVYLLTAPEVEKITDLTRLTFWRYAMLVVVWFALFG